MVVQAVRGWDGAVTEVAEAGDAVAARGENVGW